MSKQFLTKEEVSLVKGYLSSDAKNVKPIGNPAFKHAQDHAEYVVTFAKMAKDKDFKGKEADSIEAFKLEVLESLKGRDVEYVTKPEKPHQEITNKLAKEALDFINFDKKAEKADKVNKALQNFNVIKEFEEIGLFFDDEIVKLNKIYTIKEVVKAIESTIDLID